MTTELGSEPGPVLTDAQEAEGSEKDPQGRKEGWTESGSRWGQGDAINKELLYQGF